MLLDLADTVSETEREKTNTDALPPLRHIVAMPQIRKLLAIESQSKQQSLLDLIGLSFRERSGRDRHRPP